MEEQTTKGAKIAKGKQIQGSQHSH